MINFEKATSNEYPFPYMELDECFTKDILENLIKEFPDISNKPVVMGGRKKINTSLTDMDFSNWIETAPTWKMLYDYLNQDDTFYTILDYYNDDLNKWECNLNEHTSLHTDCFTHIDWSSATDGYVREIHRDTDKRIWNFIIFLSDKDWEGGDFLIHSSDELTNYPHQIWDKSLPVTKTIEAKANRGCFFLSTPNSYHSVSKQFNTKSPRKFIYGSYSYRNGDVFRKRNKQ